MKLVNTIQNLLVALLTIPAAFILLDALLTSFEAPEGNPVVDVIRTGAELFLFDALRTMFVDQGLALTTVLGVVAYALLAVLVLLLFWGIRTAIRAMRPQTQR